MQGISYKCCQFTVSAYTTVVKKDDHSMTIILWLESSDTTHLWGALIIYQVAAKETCLPPCAVISGAAKAHVCYSWLLMVAHGDSWLLMFSGCLNNRCNKFEKKATRGHWVSQVLHIKSSFHLVNKYYFLV